MAALPHLSPTLTQPLGRRDTRATTNPSTSRRNGALRPGPSAQRRATAAHRRPPKRTRKATAPRLATKPQGTSGTRGCLKNGNPPGDLSRVTACGARNKRSGQPCRAPAMLNGRCRLHGGLSTGPRTPEGLARSRRARWKHGGYSVEAQRRYLELKAACVAPGASRAERALVGFQPLLARARKDLRNLQRRHDRSHVVLPMAPLTMTDAQILEEVAQLAFSILPDPFDEHGHIKSMNRLTAEEGARFTSITVARRRRYVPLPGTAGLNLNTGAAASHGYDIVVTVKNPGKLKALALLAKYFGLYRR